MGYSSENIFTSLRSLSMVIIDDNLNDEMKYSGRLYGSLNIEYTVVSLYT